MMNKFDFAQRLAGDVWVFPILEPYGVVWGMRNCFAITWKRTF